MGSYGHIQFLPIVKVSRRYIGKRIISRCACNGRFTVITIDGMSTPAPSSFTCTTPKSRSRHRLLALLLCRYKDPSGQILENLVAILWRINNNPGAHKWLLFSFVKQRWMIIFPFLLAPIFHFSSPSFPHMFSKPTKNIRYGYIGAVYE